MNAYEFCKFFDFTLEKESGINEDGDTYNYIATDDQAVFHDRTAYKVSGLTDLFDSMLPDYVDEECEYNGFEYDESQDGTFYEQALKWVKSDENYRDTDLAGVLEALVNPDSLTE